MTGVVVDFVSFRAAAIERIEGGGRPQRARPRPSGRGSRTAPYEGALCQMKKPGTAMDTVAPDDDASHAARRARAKADSGPGIPCVYLDRRL